MALLVKWHRGAQVTFAAQGEVAWRPALFRRDASCLFRQCQELVAQERVIIAAQAVPFVGRNTGQIVMHGDLHLGTAALRGGVVRRRSILAFERIDEFLGIEGSHASGTG